MKVCVPIKRVVDPTVRVRVKSDGSGMDVEHSKMAMNPFDAIALEESIRLKEQGLAAEVIVVSIGSQAVVETLRQGLAMGADRALHFIAETDIEPLSVAKCLAECVKRESVDLVILGKQAIDNDCNQVGQMLAGLLDWPQLTCVSSVSIEANWVQCDREVDLGIVTQKAQLPAVITTDLGLNKPRYLALPAIMKAKQKTIEQMTLDALSLTLRKRIHSVKIQSPPVRPKGRMLDGVDELVALLKEKLGTL